MVRHSYGFGYVNLTSQTVGGGGGPPGSGWVRLLLEDADQTDDTYSRVVSLTETPGATGSTVLEYYVNNASLGVPSASNRYPAAGAIWWWETGLDYSTPKVIELFVEGTGFTATSNIVIWFGITHNTTLVPSTIHTNTCGSGYWISSRSRTTPTTPGGRTMYLVNNLFSPTTGALNDWQNGHQVILQPVDLLQAVFFQSIQNNSYDSQLNEWRVGNRGNPPAASTDPINIWLSISSDRVSAAGTTTETFRLWYRVTDDYFSWS